MFSQACVKNSVHKGEMYIPLGRHLPWADTHSPWTDIALLADTPLGRHPPSRHTPPEQTPPGQAPPRQTPPIRQPFRRALRILLECIFVCVMCYGHIYYEKKTYIETATKSFKK